MTLQRLPLILLATVNLLPLIGALWLDWNLKTLIVLYWIENAFVGVLAVPKMFLATERGALGKSKGYQAIFFATHYATFWVMHGAFILYILFQQDLPYRGNAVLFATIALLLFASHFASAAIDFWLGRQFERVNALKISILPYARVLPVHVFLAVVVFVFGPDATPAVLASVVAGKLIIDLLSHLALQTWYAKRPVAASPS